MTMSNHPSSSELWAALHEPARAAATLEHLEECLACRVRMARIRRAASPSTPSHDSLQWIVDASTPLPEVLTALVSSQLSERPEPNEVWRVGRTEALLVWVRQVFDDGIVDVIPMVLDVELADQETVVVAADATALGTEAAAMVALRTHVHIGAFINRIGTLDIRKDVTEVMKATHEGRRPSRVRVGPPIDDDDDQRLEYRQALRDLLAELTPSAWLASLDLEGTNVEPGKQSDPPLGTSSSAVNDIKAQVSERLWGVQCRDLVPKTVGIDGEVHGTSFLKVIYLDTAVLIVTLGGEGATGFPDVGALATACGTLMLSESDADAIAVAIPADDWPTLLFTTASMRNGFELPSGTYAGPAATLEGHGLVDTLCKHLEGAVTAWDVAEPTSNRVHRTDLQQMAAGHANTSIEHVAAEGKRARQTAKRSAWANLPYQLDEHVARFVVAVVNQQSIDDAITELPLESRE